MHGNYISRIRLQPSVQLIPVRNINGKEARVTLVIPVIFCVSAVVLVLAAADKVYRSPFRGLQLGPEFATPANYLRDTIAKGHVPDLWGRRLRAGCCGEYGQGDEAEGYHFSSWKPATLYTTL